MFQVLTFFLYFFAALRWDSRPHVFFPGKALLAQKRSNESVNTSEMYQCSLTSIQSSTSTLVSSCFSASFCLIFSAFKPCSIFRYWFICLGDMLAGASLANWADCNPQVVGWVFGVWDNAGIEVRPGIGYHWTCWCTGLSGRNQLSDQACGRFFYILWLEREHVNPLIDWANIIQHLK